jgi:predicted transcriptional regulator
VLLVLVTASPRCITDDAGAQAARRTGRTVGSQHQDLRRATAIGWISRASGGRKHAATA